MIHSNIKGDHHAIWQSYKMTLKTDLVPALCSCHRAMQVAWLERGQRHGLVRASITPAAAAAASGFSSSLDGATGDRRYRHPADSDVDPSRHIQQMSPASCEVSTRLLHGIL